MMKGMDAVKKNLLEAIVSDLTREIERSKGLEVYANGRNQFEQWMQIAVCGTLINEGARNIEVETDHGSSSPDICFESDNKKYAIELKVIVAQGGGGKSDLGKISKDISKLNGYGVDHGIILFAIFPFEAGEDVDSWANQNDATERRKHYDAIKEKLSQVIAPREFVFSNGVKGYVFSGILR